ncbi:L,D-transpeptidase [Devosia algicola]|uniref:L,D-transpeptidase n=1 Tax=Devosia algicola TaxID=3026418 RepID=A0ABY7YMQ5_9HYPH|nr:L,D-transpeptidase [Devosia algicola]WDR02443.1 L,D-transpeptidase [Devosia algicola]
MVRGIGLGRGIVALALGVVLSLSPAAARGLRFVPPPGMTITNGTPTNGLMLKADYHIAPQFLRQIVRYQTREHSGTIVVDTRAHFLYFVLGGGRALRYGIGVAKAGFEWGGTHQITRKAEWPGWTPPPEMLQRRPDLPRHMEGGPDNPLGARALYIGSTLYRIHGTTEPWSIGLDVSSGCIRMTNMDVIDLYKRVKLNSKVVVL